MRSRFNKQHPELEKGEVFLLNIVSPGKEPLFEDDMESRSGWEHLGWKTKRMGNTAYNVFGNPIDGMRPIFVKRDELMNAGANPDRF